MQGDGGVGAVGGGGRGGGGDGDRRHVVYSAGF